MLLLLIACNSPFLNAQTFNGYLIGDYIVTAMHPTGCDANYVTGLPEDSTWVNFAINDSMTATFGNSWADIPGTELLLETSYHPDNYKVKLLLSTGMYSSTHDVLEADWTEIDSVEWKHIFRSCSDGSFFDGRFILPLDFDADFDLGPSDVVVGIKITFLATLGLPDLAGIYIATPCPQISLGNDTILCPGQSLTLDATTAGGTYLWQDSSSNPTFTVTQAGTYWVEVTDSCLISRDTIKISYHPMQVVNLGNDTILCPDQTLILDATTQDATYRWQDNSTNPTFTVMQEGVYRVEVTENCEILIDSINVVYDTLPTIDLGNDTSLCTRESLILGTYAPHASYVWQDNSTSPTFTVMQEGVYWVQVNTPCWTVSDSLSVSIMNCECNLYIPNAFSPNADGRNDQFYPKTNCHFSLYQFTIVSLWGAVLFETTNPMDYWDGTYKGQPMPIGTYIYIVTYQIPGWDKVTVPGNVTLLR